MSLCVAPGTFTLTSVVSSSFDLNGNQDIVANVSYASTLTTLGNVPIGPVSLSGMMHQEVLGRTFATELGTWSTNLVALSLSGTLLDQVLTLTLDATTPSTGVTSIASVGSSNDPASGDPMYRIDSFFDVYAKLTLATTPPLETMRGPVRLSLVPEPCSLVLVISGLLAMGSRRQRKLASGRAAT